MKETVGSSFFVENDLKFHLLIFACAESSLLPVLLSSCGERGLHSGGAGASRCSAFSCGTLALRCAGFSSCSSQALEHRLSSCGNCSAACGIFLDQGLNLCLLHWQADSLPLSHREAP